MARTAAATVAAREEVLKAITGRRRDIGSVVFQLALLLTLILALAILLVLLGQVTAKALPVLQDRGGQIVSSGSSSLAERAGVRYGIVGSLYLMVFVVVIAFPLGIGAAVYMEEYARDSRLTRIINANIRNLAGVPAIVYGILGLAIFVELLGDVTGPEAQGQSLLSGGLTIAIMVLPITIITTAEALRAVPRGIREAGFGVGATRWEVIRSHVLPNAAPGILTGSVLAMARALGETAPLIMVGAVTGFLSTGGGFEAIQDRFTALPTLIFAYTKKPQPEFQEVAAAAILILMGTIFLVNLTAIILRNRYERKW
jgi:phosphate transport system permease protein